MTGKESMSNVPIEALMNLLDAAYLCLQRSIDKTTK